MSPAANTPASMEWPKNPDAGWLGEWAAKQDDLPDPMSLRTVRELYQRKRAQALTSDGYLHRSPETLKAINDGIDEALDYAFGRGGPEAH